MNADPHDLDATLTAAIDEHTSGIGAAIPEFGIILSSRQRRIRRTLATATATVAVMGLGAMTLAAANRPAGDSRAIPADSPPSAAESLPTSTSDEHVDERETQEIPKPPVVAGTTIPTSEWFCREPLGTDAADRELFDTCEPVTGSESNDYACTGRLGIDGTGRVRFTSCEAVGQLGPIANDNADDPFSEPEDLPVRAGTHLVQAGDYGLKVAAEYCVTLANLEATNSWTDAALEFPGPGSVILIPRSVYLEAEGCLAGLYTITANDTTRIAVAGQFCVSVQALDAANSETDGYSSFAPGVVILVPPSVSNDC